MLGPRRPETPAAWGVTVASTERSYLVAGRDENGSPQATWLVWNCVTLLPCHASHPYARPCRSATAGRRRRLPCRGLPAPPAARRPAAQACTRQGHWGICIQRKGRYQGYIGSGLGMYGMKVELVWDTESLGLCPQGTLGTMQKEPRLSFK